MGSQANFLMLGDDLNGFVRKVLELDETLFAPARLPTSNLEASSLMDGPIQPSEQFRGYLLRAVDRGDIVIRSVSAQAYWKIDEIHSPVVQFNNSYRRDGHVRTGRLYFQPGFYDEEGCWRPKSTDFIRWADSLLRWIRHHYSRDAQTGIYIGPDAAKWVAQQDSQLWSH